MPIFALTGNLASGKTLALKLLEKKGAVIFDADKKIHQYYHSPSTIFYKKIAQKFPQALKGGRICRKALGTIVFSDKTKLRQLEKIIHPPVIKELKGWVKKNRKKDGIYIAEVPLLFEKGLQDYFDAVILVYVAKKILVKRIMQNLSLSRTEATERINLFMPQEEKIAKADLVIDNSFHIKRFKKEVSLLWRRLKEWR
jgi:dephospho-CoA kinase